MVSFYVEFVFYDFFDKISAFWKAVICEKGKHSELAKAVSPSRALPLLATQLFSVVVGVNALTGCGIRGGGLGMGGCVYWWLWTGRRPTCGPVP